MLHRIITTYHAYSWCINSDLASSYSSGLCDTSTLNSFRWVHFFQLHSFHISKIDLAYSLIIFPYHILWPLSICLGSILFPGNCFLISFKFQQSFFMILGSVDLLLDPWILFILKFGSRQFHFLSFLHFCFCLCFVCSLLLLSLFCLFHSFEPNLLILP